MCILTSRFRKETSNKSSPSKEDEGKISTVLQREKLPDKSIILIEDDNKEHKEHKEGK